MAENIVELLTDVADAIREKKGSTEKINAQAFAEEIKNLPSGGGDNGLAAAIVTRAITDYSDDTITQIGHYAFCQSNQLISVSAPNAHTIFNLGFAYCGNLSALNFPKVTTINSQAFYDCKSLTALELNVIFLKTQAFRNCTSLTKARLDKCESIDTLCFMNCALSTLILGGQKICVLSRADAFQSTPISDGTGYIYVPDDLVDAYKGATNWSTFASQIKGLSELPQE